MVEPRSCKENSNRKPTTKNKRRRQESLEKEKPRTKTKNPTRETGKASIRPMFDLAIERSDAESKVGQRLSGVPPWENQHECTTELVGSDLVEHEKQGRHP